MLLKGKYRLGDRIGAGAMAAVFAGTHVITGRPIAVKRLLPDRLRDERALARFEREARAAGRIRSEHVVEVLDFDRDEQGAPFLVLERLFGETLAERLRRSPPLAPLEAVDLTEQALAGVADMHRAGVVHRDIKPSNVFLCQGVPGPVVKLVDFGVAKVSDEPPAHLTQLDEMLGSFSFTAPEQLRSSVDAGPAADLWSIGVLLHRMLTGEQPFVANDPGSVMAAILQRAAPRLTERGVAADVAALLQPILDRALQKRPEDRYPDAAAMGAALGAARAALGGEPSSIGAPRERPMVAGAPAPAADPLDDEPTPQPELAPEPEVAAVGVARHARPAPSPSPLGGRPTALLFAAAVGVGALSGWLATSARAASTPPAAGAAGVRVRVEPETAEVRLDGRLLERAGEAFVFELDRPGSSLEITAPGHAPRTLELPARPAAVLVRLERRFVEPAAPQAASASAAPVVPPPVDPPAGTPSDDDLEIVREAPPSPARPSRPSRSASASAGPPPSTPAASGAAPPPIRTAPY